MRPQDESNHLEELYQELIIDHAKSPRSFGELADADVVTGLFNPLCGDEVHLQLKFVGEKIGAIKFSGHGCSISQAAASMMTELLKGKEITEARRLCVLYRDMLRGAEGPQATLDDLGDSIALIGVRRFSSRIKCAMLAWEALEKALAKYAGAALLEKKATEESSSSVRAAAM